MLMMVLPEIIIVTLILTNAGRHFGFDIPSESVNDSSPQLLEGQRTEVCVLLLEPEEFHTFVEMYVQLPPGK